MKTSHVVVILAAVALLAAGGTFALKRSFDQPPQGLGAAPISSLQREQSFTVRGRIISLNPGSGIVKIAHAEIPNYMPEMTMPFMVRDSNNLRALNPGDSVIFDLAVTSDDSWITKIEKTGHTPLPKNTDARGDTESNRLKPGETVPNFTFVDQDGKNRSWSDFKDKFAIVTFIYTRCPLPNFCPLLNKKFSELQDRLQKEFPGKFHLLSVSIDPGYDTPAVLKRYASLNQADESSWTFATGSMEQIAEIAELFGLTYNQTNPGLIDHDMRTALISPEGRVIHIWKSNFWTPYEVRNRLEDTLRGG